MGSARTMYECCVEGMKFEEFFEGEVAHTIAGMMHVYFVPLQQNLPAAVVMQFDKRQSNTLGPYITEEKVLPL